MRKTVISIAEKKSCATCPNRSQAPTVQVLKNRIAFYGEVSAGMSAIAIQKTFVDLLELVDAAVDTLKGTSYWIPPEEIQRMAFDRDIEAFALLLAKRKPCRDLLRLILELTDKIEESEHKEEILEVLERCA